MKEIIKNIIDKTQEKVISIKFLVLALSTWLFYVDKLDQDGWVYVITATTGMRVVNELASMYKDIQVSKPKKK